VALIFMWVAPICAVLTLIAGAVWLIRRSNSTLIIFLVALSFTAMTGAVLALSFMLMDFRP
jgi:hypothetical protein